MTINSAGYTGYGEASARELKEILSAAYKSGNVLIIWGEPGVGKTALINAWANEMGLGEPIYLIGSSSSPEDITGLPVRGSTNVGDREVMTTEFGMPWYQAELLAGRRKVLFMDEFSCTPPAVAASLLRIVGDKTFANGEKLPDDCMIIMAANPASTAASYFELSSPMTNRIIQVSYKPTDEEVYDGLSGGWFSEEQQAAWSPEEKSWRGRIVSFLQHTNGAYILLENDLADGAIESEAPAYLQPDSEKSASECEILTSAWASPRAWDNLARMLSYTGFEKEVTPIQERIIAGTVGRQAGVEFCEYVREHSFLDPYDIIRNPSLQQWNPDSTVEGADLDEIQAVARMVSDAIKTCDGQEGRPTQVEALEFYEKVFELGGAVHFISDFCQDPKGGGHFLRHNVPNGYRNNDWVRRINDVLRMFKANNLISDEQRQRGKRK